MPIPNYQSLMFPILKFLADRKEHTVRNIMEYIYKISDLSENEKEQLLPSGREPVFQNRIRWAIWYLRKAGLIESPRMRARETNG